LERKVCKKPAREELLEEEKMGDQLDINVKDMVKRL